MYQNLFSLGLNLNLLNANFSIYAIYESQYISFLSKMLTYFSIVSLTFKLHSTYFY